MLKPEWKEIEGVKYFKFNSKFDTFKYYFGHYISILLILVMVGAMAWGIWYALNYGHLIRENPCLLCENITGRQCFNLG